MIENFSMDNNNINDSKINILFFGTPDYSVKTLESLYNLENVNVLGVITKEDKPQKRGQKVLPSPVKDFALKNNIPCFQPKSLRKELDSFFSFCKNLEEENKAKIDLSVVIAYGQILPKEVLEYPSFGSFNLHASILPHLRGAAPIQRAIMNEDDETGVCLMKMDEGLDTGDVYVEEKVKIDDTTTFSSLYETLSSLSAKIICDNINNITANKLTSKKQPEAGQSYADKILKDEALINWDLSAHKILRLINAMDPIFGAYTFFEDKRLKLFSPKISLESINNFEASPNGKIVTFTKDHINFKCKDGLLEIYEVQLEGKKRMSAKEFLMGKALNMQI